MAFLVALCGKNSWCLWALSPHHPCSGPGTLSQRGEGLAGGTPAKQGLPRPEGATLPSPRGRSFWVWKNRGLMSGVDIKALPQTAG